MTNPILIIGSNSFAGSNFCDYLLSKKFNVIGVSRSKEINQIFLKYKDNNHYKKNFSFYKIDINKDKDILKLIKIIKIKKIKYIINFASQGMVAESWLKPWDWYNTNVVSFSKLINKLKDLKITKFLNFSTPEVYGSTEKEIKENNFFNPTTPYAISRSAQDLNLHAYCKNFKFPVVFTRTANIFGPHQQLFRIVPISIIKAIKNEKINLHGSGKSIRSFIFMNDVSIILYKILKDKKNIGQTYHISTKKFLSIKKLVTLILKILKRKKTLIKNIKERDGKDFGYFLNTSKIIKEYKWKDKTSLEQGLKKTIYWIKDNLHIINNLNLKYKHKKMKKILVTGGGGYVGTLLIDALLNNGYQVTVLDTFWFGNFLQKNKNLEIIEDDIQNLSIEKIKGHQTIIHLANIANDPTVAMDPELSWNVNVLGTHSLIDKASRAGVEHFIFGSSGSVYGVKEEPNVVEDMVLVPISTYNKTKMIAERVIMSYSESLRVHCIRPATVCGYSPRMRLDISVNLLTMQALKKGEITVFGGNQTRPNINIKDMINVYLHFISNSNIENGYYNAGLENMTILKIAEIIKEKTGATIKIEPSNDPRSYRQNSDKLISTGFKFQYNVDNAIEEIITKYNNKTLEDKEIYYNLKVMKNLKLDKIKN